MTKQSQLLISFSLLLATASAAQAQGLVAAPSSFGSDQDSLLPPEVVPLDPSAANSLSASQAQSRQSNMNFNDSVPGLVGGQPAQDMRKQAFDSLYGQNQIPQEAATQWRAGQQQGMPAQNPTYPMASNQTQQGFIAQSQTLTGAPKNQPQLRDTRRAGISNVLNYATAFGAGAIMSGFLMRPGNAFMGAGMYGLSMTGLGVRNGSRF